MNWAEVCEDKSLQDLPYKIELNEWGQIMMTPASNRHGKLQSQISFLLMSQMKEGTVIIECSVDTAKGTKVADVAWLSDKFEKRNGEETPFQEAPEICIEIRSASNTDEEMAQKKELYFAKGAKEFWLCDEDGNLSFHSPDNQINQSILFPSFPINLKH